MKKVYILILIFPFFAYSQIDVKFLNNFNLPISELELQIDSNALKIIQIPLLGFSVDIYSNPDLRIFTSKNINNILINPNNYYQNMDEFSSHILDVKNHILYYAFKSEDSFYSFGLDHCFWMETSFSKEFMSLIINGNYPNLNNTITLNDNGGLLFNYFSLFFGYSQKLENTIFGAKLKLLKGLNIFGIDGQQTSIYSVDNFYTENTPFTTEFNTDFDAYRGSETSFFSNLGIAFDFSIKHNFSDKISLFSSVSDLGFIYWQKDHYFSQGNYTFDGVDYTLEENLISEFNNLYDSVVDVFDIQEIKKQNQIKSLSYNFDFGVGYLFDVITQNKLTINYNFKKLNFGYNLLHTGSISYTKYFQRSQISITPIYSFNRYSYTNISVFIGKKWKDRMVTNLYCQNIFNSLKESRRGMNLGLGVELFLLF